MLLKIISTTAIVYQGEATLVSLPGVQGRFTVLHNHASIISALGAGDIRHVDADGTEHRLPISGGIVDVDKNVIAVCIY